MMQYARKQNRPAVQVGMTQSSYGLQTTSDTYRDDNEPIQGRNSAENSTSAPTLALQASAELQSWKILTRFPTCPF